MAAQESKQLRAERKNLEDQIKELLTKCAEIEAEKMNAVAKVRDSVQFLEEANLQKSKVNNALRAYFWISEYTILI